ncbi:MAG: helix-turn-helix domain-containing protein [Saprospiraceae bacterium]|nr:helix-turn-helix domain-containing protein [Saprospiraceae bacterium]
MTVYSLSDQYTSHTLSAGSNRTIRKNISVQVADLPGWEKSDLPQRTAETARFSGPATPRRGRQQEAPQGFQIQWETSLGDAAGEQRNLLSNISQELRAPLKQISGPVAQLQRAGNQLSENERHRLYGIIGQNALKILEFVDQLLELHPAPDAPAVAALDTAPPAPAEIPAPEPVERRYSLLTPKGRRCSTYDDQLLQKLAELLEANLEETDFTVHKMCALLHLSHMQFIRKIKQLTGKKPIDLLKSFRLKRAKDLLRQNNLTVAEIAYKVGYDMPNSFSRAFKKEFGISPTEFVG